MSDKVSFLCIAYSNESINVCQFSGSPSKLFIFIMGSFTKAVTEVLGQTSLELFSAVSEKELFFIKPYI